MTARMLAIEYVPVASLRLNPENPRLHSQRQVRQLANSIRNFEFNVPVLVDAQLRVVAGHGRVLASKLLGMTQIPAIRLEHLSEHQARAFMIADNRLAENAEWDNRLLGEQLKILSEAEIDFTLEATGFEAGEIDLMIENLSPAPEREADPADAVPESPSVQVSQASDLWVLGKHRVLCGNALSRGSFEVLMDGRQAQIIFTDPPYNLALTEFNWNSSGDAARIRKRHGEFTMGSGEMNEVEFTKFLTDALVLLANHSVAESLHYVCMDWRHMGELLAAGRVAYSSGPRTTPGWAPSIVVNTN